jgi:hypothetical protein
MARPISLRPHKHGELRKQLDAILDTGAYGKGKTKIEIDKRKYNKAKLDKFYKYVTNENEFREHLDGARGYRKAIEQDEFLMLVLDDVRKKKYKIGAKKQIEIETLMEDMEGYCELDFKDDHPVPSIASFLMRYSTQQISESRFYQILDENPENVELLELKEKIKTLRKSDLDIGGATGRYSDRHVGNAMRQVDVTNPWDEADKDKLDGKRGFADLIKDLRNKPKPKGKK